MSSRSQGIKKDSKHFKKTPNLKDYNKTYKEFSWEKAEKEYLNFFEDKTLNAAYIAIDKHIQTDKKEKTALIFHAADGNQQKYTFSDLAKQTNKFANVLKNLGIKKGDRV